MIDFIADQEHEVTEILAYKLWEQRGRPLGSPEVDWFEAKYQLATGLAKDGAVVGVFGMGMEPEEGPWVARRD
jgi:hypothetical protein